MIPSYCVNLCEILDYLPFFIFILYIVWENHCPQSNTDLTLLHLESFLGTRVSLIHLCVVVMLSGNNTELAVVIHYGSQILIYLTIGFFQKKFSISCPMECTAPLLLPFTISDHCLSFSFYLKYSYPLLIISNLPKIEKRTLYIVFLSFSTILRTSDYKVSVLY